MGRFFSFLFGFFFLILVQGKVQRVEMQFSMTEQWGEVKIKQKVFYKNEKNNPIESLVFSNWISAYSNPKSPFFKRKLENQDKNLYFASQKQKGALKKLEIKG